MSTKMTPQLRFPEFTDEWQVKKLGDVFDEVTDKVGTKGIETYSITAGKGFVSQKEKFGQDISGTQNERYTVLREGDLSYNKGNSKTYNYGCVYENKTGKQIAVPNVFISFRLKNKNMRPGFYGQMFINRYLDPYLLKIISSGARMDGLLNVNKKEFFSINVPVASIEEQEKIADFLTAVDERIGVSEKKLELLETYKRGVMQKIFTRAVRFKDENGNPYPDWEEKKLSDVLKERNMQTPISGEYPLMAFVAYKGVAPKGDRYNREFLVSDAKSKKYKQTQLGDFIYSSNNLETGSIGLNLYGSASISPVYSIFETKDGYSHQFLGAYLTRKKFIYQMVRYRQGVVYGQWRIHESEFLKIEEKFPCTGEQQKIADFLTALDDKITAEKSKLTAAREFKKALLQRMFV